MSTYLERYAWPHECFPDYQPPADLSLIVVIPCFKEPDLIGALESLSDCKYSSGKLLVIVVLNEPEKASQEIRKANEHTMQDLQAFQCDYPVLVTQKKLPQKKAGVGLARKIGMDEAVRLYKKARKDGPIVCFDADCRCDANYLKEIDRVYQNKETQSGIVFYEHSLHRENHKAIVDYELYLRYYIDALRFAHFPYAHQTLGSCITVRSSMYEKVGGMNTRKAGEDFYFLNKTIPHGGFVEINSTTVRPSDRVSDRVPFGTGKAVNDILQDDEKYHVYHPNTFEDLKLLFNKVENFWNEGGWKIPMTVQTFLGPDWEKKIIELKDQVGSEEQFRKRFFHWFDAFKILKFVHFCRDEFYQNVELEDALEWLRQKHFFLKGTKESLLIQMRYFDRQYENES